jgi:hypothetical protein
MGAVSLKSSRIAERKTGDLRRLKPEAGKPVKTGWRVLGVGYPALKDRSTTRLRRGKPCEHGLVALAAACRLEGKAADSNTGDHSTGV